MARKAHPAEWQGPGVCSWCGHRTHGPACAEVIKVAAGPSGGAGRAVPLTTVLCPCQRWRWVA